MSHSSVEPVTVETTSVEPEVPCTFRQVSPLTGKVKDECDRPATWDVLVECMVTGQTRVGHTCDAHFSILDEMRGPGTSGWCRIHEADHGSRRIAVYPRGGAR